MDAFSTRVRVYRALDVLLERTDWVLTQVRGLGIESPLIKYAAFGAVVAGLGKTAISPHGKDGKLSPTTAALALSVWPPASHSAPGWTRFGSTWVWVGMAPNHGKPDHSNVYLRQGETEAALWAELRDAFAERFPAAVLAERRFGAGVEVVADRPTNVRRMVTWERELAERLRKYVDAGVPTSVLLYGPQGSAKTTAACSIADAIVGSYFRLSASNIGSEEIHTLVELKPRALILDDIDRVNDVALLELLDAMTAAGVIVFGTSNTAPDGRHGDVDVMDAALVRSGRFDHHVRVNQLDAESHAQICRANGLAKVDLGPRADELLASDLVALGRRHAAGDLTDVSAVVDDLLLRRTNNTRRLHSQPPLGLTLLTSG